MWCASGAQRLPADRSADTPTVVATVVPARSPCSPWLPVVDLDVQRLADKIISRCYVPADHRDNHAVFTCDPALLERAAGGGLIAFVGCQLRRLFSRAAGLATRVKLVAHLGVAATMINWTALWRAFMISCRTAMLWGHWRRGQLAAGLHCGRAVTPCSGSVLREAL